jgi:hypothetical protein
MTTRFKDDMIKTWDFMGLNIKKVISSRLGLCKEYVFKLLKKRT